MRASPRRSPVWLASPAALLVLVACTPQLDLHDRPPPCAPGYAMCPSRGVCVAESALTSSPLKPLDKLKDLYDACPYGIDIRQGATVSVPVPGASAMSNDVTAVASWNSDAATVKPAGNGVTVEVNVPHGTLPGDMGPAGKPYVLSIQATIGGVKVDREIPVIVSPIAVSTDGNDDNDGTAIAPFKTLRKAVSVAGLGDTVLLRLSKDNLAFFDANDSEAIAIPKGVNVEGQLPLHPNSKSRPEDLRAKLDMPLSVEGDATLANLRLAHRLTITAADTKVAFNNVAMPAGVTVDASARAAFLRITNKSEVTTDDEKVNPLLVEADEVGISIETGTTVQYNGSNTALETMLFAGAAPTLHVWDDSLVKTTIAPCALRMLGASAVVDFDGHETKDGVRVLGKAEILGADSKATFRRTAFALSMLVGGLVFSGKEMSVSHTVFMTEGITQDGVGSKVTVRDSQFLTYTRTGYHLKAGTLDMGTMADPGHNAFTKTDETWLGTIPTALIIDAPAPPDGASATVSMTTFDAEMPVPCRVTGHETAPWRYDVAKNAILDFF